MRNIFILIVSILATFYSYSQCNGADPFCTGTSYNFPNSTGVANLGSVDCLGSTPNPAWYYMEIDQNGSMVININQQNASGTGLDVDFILWGPFSSLNSACAGANPFPAGSAIDCSYSANAAETATIPNAQMGQVYVMLITNFSNQPGNISFSQISGSGSADCSFTCGVNLTATPSVCNNNTYSVSGNLTVTAGPGISVPNSGTVTIANSCGGSQTFNAPFTNIPYNFTGLTANGAGCVITATFSNFPNCNTVQNYTAPASCVTPCSVSSVTATPTACSANQYNVNGQVSFTNPPATGTLTVTGSCGGTQTFNAPFTSPLSYSFSNLTANGAACSVTATFSANTSCTNIGNYSAPQSCNCSVTGITATPTACSSNQFSLNGNISFSNPPTTGTLTVSSSCGGTQTFNAPFTSPLAYSLSGLPANGAGCTVTATFSANTSCALTQNFTAPSSCNCSISGITATPTSCSNNQYSLGGNISFANAPATGTLTITGSCGGTQTFNAPFTSPQTYNLTGLTANGAGCTVTATFSANTSCTLTQNFTAPSSCNCSISGITATPTSCSSNQYSLGGNISFANAPATGTLTITGSCGGTQTFNAPFTSPQAYNLTGLTANGAGCTVTATFSANTSCTLTQNYTAPASCNCSITSLSATPTACSNNLYNVSGAITFNSAPATGTLTVSGCGGTQTFNAPFTSPQAYNFTGLTANGANCNVTATFSALPACTRSQTYTAPVACLNAPCVQNPFCSNNGVTTFPAGTNQVPADITYPNNDYGCLFSTPNPEWYYMQVAAPGTLGINMSNSSNVDIDYILYGPYTSLNNALTYCDNFGTATTGSNTNLIVDCSFSGSANETANIANAQTGQVYVLLITNFSNQPTNISFTSSGTATTDCNIVTPSTCVAEIGTYNYNLTGDTQSQTMLCFGDQLNLTTNNDFVVPELITGGTAPIPVYDPGVSWLVYSCPPTVALTPAQSAATQLTVPDDPCFIGIYANTPSLTDLNDMSIINGQPAGTFTNNTVYFVPITMYSLVEGLYSYVILPANDCYELGTPIAIQYLPEIVAVQNPNCANGTVSVTLTGGAPQVNGTNFNVVIGSQSPASATFLNTSVANGGSIILGNLTDGPYSFDIVDDNGCPITISGDYVGPQSAAITYPDNLYCLNEPNPIPTLVGNAGGTYTSGNGLSINPITGQINLATSTPGAYAITYTTPGNQCPATSTFNLTIEAFPVVDAGPDLTVCVGKPIILNGSGAISYSWNNGLQNNVPYLPNLGLTQFVVIGSSNAGCIGIDSINVIVVGECDSLIDVIYWVPNTFTPDGDQYNQTFLPIFYSGIDPYSYDFYVYNRWGELIWENHDTTFGWDGTYNDGMKCPDGTYTWKIRYKLINNDEKQTVHGHVNLIR